MSASPCGHPAIAGPHVAKDRVECTPHRAERRRGCAAVSAERVPGDAQPRSRGPSSPFMHPVDRPLPAVQRAYFYLVALVAIHMVVLAVANLLRVGAELALGAPSGGFTGLPFVFNEFSRPAAQYREQSSRAIARLVV